MRAPRSPAPEPLHPPPPLLVRTLITIDRPPQQAHLKKLFAGIHRVRFAPDGAAIAAMVSVDGEEAPLAAPVVVSEAVEAWLAQLRRAALVVCVCVGGG